MDYCLDGSLWCDAESFDDAKAVLKVQEGSGLGDDFDDGISIELFVAREREVV